MAGRCVVHVLFARPEPLAGGDATACLDAADHAHVARFRFARDRTVAAASRVLQRLALAHAAGGDASAAAALRFETDASGRPHVAAPTAMRHWRFSASNTHGLVACAVVDDAAVGIDVERVQRALAPELVAHCCSDTERRALEALPDGVRGASFHALWTRKEAYLKARGIGLSVEPRTIGFGAAHGDADASVGNSHVVVDPQGAGDAGAWRVVDLPAGGQHVAALCVRDDGIGPDVRVSWAGWRDGALVLAADAP